MTSVTTPFPDQWTVGRGKPSARHWIIVSCPIHELTFFLLERTVGLSGQENENELLFLFTHVTFCQLNGRPILINS